MTCSRLGYMLKYVMIASVLITTNVFSQNVKQHFDLNYIPYKSESVIQDKLFYFFTAAQKHDGVSKLLMADQPLNDLLKQLKDKHQIAANTCGMNISCHLDAFTWQSDHIELVSRRLSKLYDEHKLMRNFVKEHLRATGNYQRYHDLDDSGLLIKVWSDAIKGVNNIIALYGRGETPLYPKIDSIAYNKNETFFKKLIDINVNSVVGDANSMDLFFEPSLQLAMDLLDSNDRNEAAAYEPMHIGENEKAVNYIRNIDWNLYKYSVILVPGYGPEDHGIALSPIARFRLKLAVERFKNKLAPIIVVSGGRVHPVRTVYNEAIEMKKELMKKYGIPEEAIIIEPHARHTTTNFRNTSRLIYRYGIPTDKLALATTTKYQSEYITHTNFLNRCIRDLQYVPIALGKKLTDYDIEFSPLASSLHIDVMQPLDP